MRAEILAVGTEILLGQIVDTNSAYIAQELSANGINLYGTAVVGDNLNRIVDAMRYSLSKCDALIVTGGLGPTQDDITRNAVAKVMGVELVEDSHLKEIISGFFAQRNRDMPQNNLLQALVPKGALYIEQRRGTAPGLICSVGNKVIYCLPGVPHEMKEMLSRAVIPDMLTRAETGLIVKYTNVMTWGMSESSIAHKLAEEFERLEQLQKKEHDFVPSIAFLANLATGIKVRISVSGKAGKLLDQVLDEEVFIVSKLLGDCVFSTKGETIEEVIQKYFVSSGLTLSFVESITGGLISARLIDIPGASDYLRGSMVAYQSEIKHSVLKVESELVVSDSAVRELSQNGLEMFDSDVCVSVSGVAGPQPQDGRDPGTVFIGIAVKKDKFFDIDLTPKELKLYGTRESIRQMAATSAFDFLRKRIGIQNT